MSDCGIYQIEHLASGKKYIGSAVRLKRRLSKHKTDLRGGYHHSQKLQRAWAKYGEQAFVFSTIELVVDETQLLAREQHWIDTLQAVTQGFNICPLAGNCHGRTLSPEHKAKLAASLTGRKRPTADHANLTGTARSAETRAKISTAKKGVPLSAEALTERKTRRPSPESNAKRSATQLGRARDPAVNAKAWATRRANRATLA